MKDATTTAITAITDSRGRTLALIGPVVCVQVQRDPLKQREGQSVWYDPAPLVTVAALELTPTGVIGRDDAETVIMDVHNAAHPASKFRGENGVSIGFTSHYAKMRDRFGAHLTDGIGAEGILVATDAVLSLDDVAAGFVIVTANGEQIALDAVEVAEPCAPFSRFCLQLPPDRPADASVTEALRFLRGGTRGFYATLSSDHSDTTATTTGNIVRPGDTLYRAVENA